MLFSSVPFLFWFLPIVMILYFIVPFKFKNSVLLISSLFFYAWGEPRYVILMAVSILLGFVFGLLIERAKTRKAAAVFLAASIITSIGMLGYFKYADFFIENFNALTGLSYSMLKISLPIGISFYTFQLLSYTIDVYRKTVPANKNIINFAAYVSMFPQLIAGPIVRYQDIEKELKTRTHSLSKASYGISRFITGLAKKVLIANSLGELTDIFRSSNDKSVLFYWMYAIAFTLQIYFDFSGYSDMAIGLGRIFGFTFSENFDYPYISKSITEFWRRWHISLGTWFRDYVYIPLGGNRVSKFRHIINILIVWMLTGFWHGAAWQFILWGLMYALLLIAEKLFLKKRLEKIPSFFSHFYVLFFVCLGFVLFNAPDLPTVISDISAIFGFSSLPFSTPETLYYLRSYALTLIIGVIAATPVVKRLSAKLSLSNKGQKAIAVIKPVLLLVLLLVVSAYLVDGSFNPFLYFRF